MMEGQLHHVAVCLVQTTQPEQFNTSIVLTEKGFRSKLLHVDLTGTFTLLPD